MLIDTAGQEEYRAMWGASCLHSDAFLLVYDMTNSHSLDTLEYFADLIDKEANRRMEVGHGVPPVMLVVGNKCDLENQRQVRSRKGLRWAREHNCGFMETSAKEMIGVEEAFARMYPYCIKVLLTGPLLTHGFSFGAQCCGVKTQ